MRAQVVIGENDSFMGEEQLLKSRGVEIDMVDSSECKQLMRDFMAEKPELWNEDIGE